ncbi:16S rRNA (guanine(527)-N(7))-methyltransferase RsmG [uncultured Adlercreutzia sp.]|uniref:16S rRNA (guanine(527)-N(7))-methyltransferase RsmG n=1 Tax=uncultured Adlercreutzia sp. TaxID=875803 RepID=UPI0026179AED|nr:16S rRNA (guanine(527)-N(7))-methyltransferase RsmG [uncultured Adlercreutzia sp.]MCI9261385.1 16S rRNA (guanine(527)-N(7))-methyltransferase RsmG [Eggerthellaceae bacterium]
MAPEKAREEVERYLDGILEINKTTNLTRITSRDDALMLHIEDSLVGLPEIEDAPEGDYADLGSGGGFPGVPIALYSGRNTLLVDSVKKKMRLVKELVDELGHGDQISVYDGRIEDLALQKKGQFSVVTARALSRLVSLLELSSPLLRRHGRLVCYKADISPEELEEADAIADLVGMKLVSRRDVLLSDGETKRTILVYEKVSSPRLKLPRRVGMAQKNPLRPRS